MKPGVPNKLDVAALTRASCANPKISLRAAGGGDLSDEKRDEMLRRAVAGEYVELELEVLAYEQRAGVTNRNFVRFRDGALIAMGRTGVGTPFLRNHDQHEAMARGGTIIASQTEKRAEGDYAIRQTVKLTAPWAVELALRGLMDTVSIGWDPTGDVVCSVCSTNFYRCSHYPGRRYSAREDEGGNRVFVLDPKGALVCEAVFTAADLVETSNVNVPAVPAASIESIRAAFSLALNRGATPHGDTMNPELLALLGLAATAGDTEVLSAVKNRIERLKLTEQARDAAVTRVTELETKCSAFEAMLKQQAVDAFVADGVKAGKILGGGKSAWEASLRKFFAVDPEGAREMLAAAPAVTPVGQPSQSGGAPPPEPRALHGNADEVIRTSGGSGVDAVRENLLKMGFAPAAADKMLAKHVGGVKGGN